MSLYWEHAPSSLNCCPVGCVPPWGQLQETCLDQAMAFGVQVWAGPWGASFIIRFVFGRHYVLFESGMARFVIILLSDESSPIKGLTRNDLP